MTTYDSKYKYLKKKCRDNNYTPLMSIIEIEGERCTEESLLRFAINSTYFPCCVNKSGETDLIFVCKYNKSIKVALALMASENSKPGNVSNNGETALSLARSNGMTEVVKLIEDINFQKRIQKIYLLGLLWIAYNTFLLIRSFSLSR